MYKIYFIVICIPIYAEYYIRFQDLRGQIAATAEISSAEYRVIQCLASQENFTGEIIYSNGKADIKSNFYLYPYISIYQAMLTSYFISPDPVTFKHLGIKWDTIFAEVTESQIKPFVKTHCTDNSVKLFLNPMPEILTDVRFSIIVPRSSYLEAKGLAIDRGSNTLYIKTDYIEGQISLNRYIDLPNFPSILSNIVNTANANYYFLHQYYIECSSHNNMANAKTLDELWIRALKTHLENEIDWVEYLCGLPERLSKRNDLLKIPRSDMLTLIGVEKVQQTVETQKMLNELSVGILR